MITECFTPVVQKTHCIHPAQALEEGQAAAQATGLQSRARLKPVTQLPSASCSTLSPCGSGLARHTSFAEHTAAGIQKKA